VKNCMSSPQKGRERTLFADLGGGFSGGEKKSTKRKRHKTIVKKNADAKERRGPGSKPRKEKSRPERPPKTHNLKRQKKKTLKDRTG